MIKIREQRAKLLLTQPGVVMVPRLPMRYFTFSAHNDSTLDASFASR
jgi:hypothetical protein